MILQPAPGRDGIGGDHQRALMHFTPDPEETGAVAVDGACVGIVDLGQLHETSFQSKTGRPLRMASPITA